MKACPPQAPRPVRLVAGSRSHRIKVWRLGGLESRGRRNVLFPVGPASLPDDLPTRSPAARPSRRYGVIGADHVPRVDRGLDLAQPIIGLRAPAAGVAIRGIDSGAAAVLPTVWLIVRRADGRIVGDLGTRGPPGNEGCVEIGYSLTPSVRGKGIGTAAVAALVGRLARCRGSAGLPLHRRP